MTHADYLFFRPLLTSARGARYYNGMQRIERQLCVYIAAGWLVRQFVEHGKTRPVDIIMECWPTDAGIREMVAHYRRYYVGNVEVGITDLMQQYHDLKPAWREVVPMPGISDVGPGAK